MPKVGKHPEKKLTAIAVKNTTKPGRYTDGGGLYLVVELSGAKRWICRTVVQGRRRDIGLGGLSTVSLAEAREKALEARKSARSGGDPIADRQAARRHIPTFLEALGPVHAEQKKAWANGKHQDQWITTLRTYAVPIIGSKRLDRIETADIVRVLEPIWSKKPETARRVRQRLSTVLKWAKASGFREGSNPVEGAEMGLARQGKSKKHHAALPFLEMPDFLKSLEKCGSGENQILAFKFLILTAARTGEVLGAKWTEFDLDKGTWTVPAERMKAKKEHRVPLGPRVKEILENAKNQDLKSEFVFPGQKAGKPLSGMVFLMLLRRIKWPKPLTAHGFRSTFSDWASETTTFSADVREMALAHAIKNRVEAAYRRGDLFEKRRELMMAWETFSTEGTISA